LNCEIEQLDIRLFLWKLFLGNLPINNNITNWVSVTYQKRNIYKNKKKEINRMKKFGKNPLENENYVNKKNN
jgi:hypothetical protein